MHKVQYRLLIFQVLWIKHVFIRDVIYVVIYFGLHAHDEQHDDHDRDDHDVHDDGVQVSLKFNLQPQ